jgi:hypothetical protein
MNIQELLVIQGYGTATSGCDPAVAEAHGTKCGRPTESVESRKPKIDTIGATRMASNREGAVQLIVAQLTAIQDLKPLDPYAYDDMHDPEFAQRVRRNWLKNLRGAFADVLPERIESLRKAIQYNNNNPLWKALQERYGSDAVVIRRPENDNDIKAGERIGGVSFIYDTKWGGFDTRSDDIPKAGSTTAQSLDGLPAVLRHEYGHHIWRNGTTLEFREAWREAFNEISIEDIQKRVTYYAGGHPNRDDECFCEMLAIRTHPKFDEANYPGVEKLWRLMDQIVK